MERIFFVVAVAIVLLAWLLPVGQNIETYGTIPNEWTRSLMVSRDPTRLDMWNLSQAYLGNCLHRIKLPITQQHRTICSDEMVTGLLNDVCR